MGEQLKIPMFVALVDADKEQVALAIVKTAQRAGVAFKKQLTTGQHFIVSEKRLWGTANGEACVKYGEIVWTK